MTRALDVAVGELGVEEETGQNDGVPAKRYMRGDKLPWCAGFVLYCNARSDDKKVVHEASDYWRNRAVAQFEADMRRRDWFKAPVDDDGKIVYPEPNDFIFFGSRGGSDASATGRHMGIVERVEGTVIHTIEGNWGNKVQRVQHDMTDHATRLRVAGYARAP